MLFTGIYEAAHYLSSGLLILIQLAPGQIGYYCFWMFYLHPFSIISCKTDKLNIQFFHSLLINISCR